MVNGNVGFGKDEMCSYKHTHNGAVHIHATFHIKGTISFSNTAQGTVATISAKGVTAAGNFVDVKFNGVANLVVNGKTQKEKPFRLPRTKLFMHETGTYPLGFTSFLLPQKGNVEIQIQAGYSFSSVEGAGAPTPSSLTRTISIPVFNQKKFYFHQK